MSNEIITTLKYCNGSIQLNLFDFWCGKTKTYFVERSNYCRELNQVTRKNPIDHFLKFKQLFFR